MTGSAVDDVTISNNDVLWRRIRPDRYQLVKDENLGVIRPTSAAFSNSSDGTGMSVVLGNQVLAEGRTPESTLKHHPGQLLTSITAGLAREHGQIVVREPEEDEPAHAAVIGEKSRKTRSDFAKKAEWVILPPADFQFE